MAKKSSKKSTKYLLLDLLTLVFAGCLLGFLALPYAKSKVNILGGTSESPISGYSMLDFNADSGLATVILLLVIFASILALLGLLKVCCDTGVIKNKSVVKLIKFGLILFALASLVMTIVAMIVVPSKCSSIGGSSASLGTYADWFVLILSTIMGVGALFSSVLSAK